MDRVQTLCNKLSGQLAQRAPIGDMLLTVQMLHSELAHLGQNDIKGHTPIAVDIATNLSAKRVAEPEQSAPQEEKIVNVLQIDEAEVAAELEEIKRNAEERNKISAQNKPSLAFDPIEDIPTLTHQQTYESSPVKKELHESLPVQNKASLNDKLKQVKLELADTLTEIPIKDLRKAIGINDRFLFINELFRGDETMYERSIKTINGFSIFPEAEYWIKRELKLKLAWDDKNEAVQHFDQLVIRRFS